MESSKPSPDRDNVVPIRIKKLWMTYPGYWLLIPELSVPTGFVAILGESGSGKSTLLNFLALLAEPRGGKIFWHGQSQHEIGNLDACRRDRFSFLFQSSNLISNFTNRQNISISRGISGHSPSSTNEDLLEDVTAALFAGEQLVGKGQLLDRFPSSLSGGQRQRIAVARALIKAKEGAQFLFGDEPTANIDKKTAGQCIGELKDWCHSAPRNLLLVATHDLSIASKQADHLVLIGLATGELREHVLRQYREEKGFQEPSEDDRVFTVLISGPSSKVYGQMEDALLQRSDDPITQTVTLDAEKQHAFATDNTVNVLESTPTRNPGRLLAQSAFLLSYCYRDIRRKREMVYNASRLMAVLMLFGWLAISASLLIGVPRVADGIFRRDPLLRLVELQSLGGFVIPPETMEDLAHLRRNPLDGELDTKAAGASLIAGVIPRRDFSCRFYDKSGLVRKKWTNGGRWVFHGTSAPDPLFDFWDIVPPLTSNTIIIRADLLKELGFDPTAIPVGDSATKVPAVLFIDVFDKVGLRIDQVVDSFPDPHIDFLIPAKLADQIRTQEMRREDESVQFISFFGYPDKASATRDLDMLRVFLKDRIDGIDGEFTIRAERRPVEILEGSTPIFQVTVRPPDRSNPPDMKQWEHVVQRYHSIPRKDKDRDRAYPVSYGGIKPPTVSADAPPPPRTSVQATMYVHDYKDIPDIIDYISEATQRSHFKLEVANKKNKETIRTVERSISLGRIIISLISVAVTVLCVLCLAFSFIPQIHRKSGEIGIIRAYGATKGFVFLRFMVEIVLTCALGFSVALAAYAFFVVPVLNSWVLTQAPDLFGPETGPPLTIEWVWTGLLSGAVMVVVAIVVGFVIYSKVGKKPAELLSLAD